MNKDKQYPDEYKLTSSLWTKIPFFFFFALVIYVLLEYYWQTDWITICILSVCCVCFLYVSLQYIEYAIFNHKGVLIVQTKRWGKNMTKREFYIDWKDVKDIRFNFIIGRHSPPAIYIESRILGHGYSQPTSMSYCKFASLAKYYSGRENIIYSGLKRKPFEKDW